MTAWAAAYPHAFTPDSARTWLHCKLCGCERGGVHHTNHDQEMTR